MGDLCGTRIKVPNHNPKLTRPVGVDDIPVLVGYDIPAPPTRVMDPPPAPQHPDVTQVTHEKTKRLVLEATKALLVAVAGNRPLIQEMFQAVRGLLPAYRTCRTLR